MIPDTIIYSDNERNLLYEIYCDNFVLPTNVHHNYFKLLKSISITEKTDFFFVFCIVI